MPEPPRIYPVPCPFGQGSVVYVYYVDTPQPALIDTGVAASPADVIEPALRAAGLRFEDLRWILATHGHFDHIGGAHAAHELAGDSAQVAIHRDDAGLLADRTRHLEGYAGARVRYLDDPALLAQADAMLMENISGDVRADRTLEEGDRVDLGGGVSFEVIHTPGHSPGSATYVLDGLNWAFCGDAVQVTGSSGNKFPLYVDAGAYRGSLDRLLNEVRPARLFLGHRYRDLKGEAFEAQLEGEAIADALRQSLEFENRVAGAASQLTLGDAAIHAGMADLAPAAELLGYSPTDPHSWPPSFVATLSSYLQEP